MKYFKIISPENLFIGFVLITAGLLNLQLLNGSNMNFQMSGHDEYIAVREVYIILNPLSWKHFFMAVISGDILYYGRILFYTDALLAFLPFKLFGIEGLVYTIRMVHTLFMLSAFIVLGRIFLKDWFSRILFFLGTSILYYSLYFFMIPKPDPMQLLVLSIFLHFFIKNNFEAGKYFIFLGIAYGIKFNIITLIPWIFLIPFINGGSKPINNLKEVTIAFFYFIAGLVIAVPCLLFAPIKPVFLKSYLNSTFGYVDQYDDNLNQGMLEWITKGWFGAYNGGTLFGVILVVLLLAALYTGIKEYITTRKLSQEIVILISGLLLFLPVIVLTKRIWPHYLWSGYIFIFLGLVMFIQKINGNRNLKIALYSLVLIIIGGSIKSTIAQGNQLFHLERNSKKLLYNGQLAYQYLKGKNGEFTSVQDLSVPYPFSEMLKARPYHPFASAFKDTVRQKFIWQGFISPQTIAESQADYIITGKTNFNDSSDLRKTVKDITQRKNNELIRAELGKSIFYDTAFGTIRIYSVLRTEAR